MKKMWSKFSFTIILPSLISLILFVVLIFFVILPHFEDSIMERKKEMIKELTSSAWSILNEKNLEVKDSVLSLDEAQKEAVMIIRNLKYGEDMKDYFWITDMHPNMVIHPYRPDLKGKDLSDYADPNGKKLFVECVKTAEKSDEGFVDYMWQYREDSTLIVPKLSYVKGFQPWGWVIGTGIYIEDVKMQISELTNRLLMISLLISVIIGSLLFWLVRVNLVTEKKRIFVNKKLNESYEKYKTLVDASTEGIIMILNEEKSFYNHFIVNLLGYTNEEFKELSIYDLLIDREIFEKIFKNDNPDVKFPKNIETKLIKKNGDLHDAVISVSRLNFHGEQGYILAVKDVGTGKDAEIELDQNIEKFKAITNNIDIGIFRTTIGRRGRFIEINKSAVELLGCKDFQNIYNINILDLFYNSEEKKEITDRLSRNENIKRQSIRIKRLDGTVITAMVSLFVSKDESGRGVFCDGIIQDITMQKKLEQEKDSMIEELLTAGLFMNQSLQTVAETLPACDIYTPVETAVKLMVKKKSDALLVHIEQGKPLGIVTHSDLGERVLLEKLPENEMVTKIMSSPVISVPSSSLLFEALLKMREKDINHICVENPDGTITGAVNIREIAYAKYQTHNLLMQRIKKADSVEELRDIFNSSPLLLQMLIESGAKTNVITRINSNFSDEITERILHLEIRNSGKPPVDFAFITLGSVGRGEQTFLTDQDNAIIYADVPNEEEASVKEYFLKLAEQVNRKLHDVGYNYCKGDVMAKNPKWCMSISEWKNQFKNWIINSSPHDLLECNIFFDIRNSGGSIDMTNELRAYIYELAVDKQVFFYHLAETVLAVKPPISFFGNFIVESTKENKSVFDIKKVIMLITGIARLYALKHSVKDTSTTQRLKTLHLKGVFTDDQYNTLNNNFNYLMLMRLNHQLDALRNNKEPNNLINPKNLSELERTSLKKIFSQLSNFQAKISLDFKGSV